VLIGDWVCQNHTFQPLGLPPEAKDIFKSPVRVTRAQVPQFLDSTGRNCSPAACRSKISNWIISHWSRKRPRFLLELKASGANSAPCCSAHTDSAS